MPRRNFSSFLPLLGATCFCAGWSPAALTSGAPSTTAPSEPSAEQKKGELPPMTRAMEQATVFARQATEAMRREDWEKAREMWLECLKLQPESAAVLSNLGSVEIKLNKQEDARAHLEKALKIRPNLPAAWMTLGLLHHEMKNPMLAISALTRAVHEDPADARLHNALAIVLKQSGWTNGAEMELQKAIDLTPDYAEAHFNLALLYLEQKPPAVETARRHYQKARDLGADPDELVEKQLKEYSNGSASGSDEGAAKEGAPGGEKPKSEKPAADPPRAKPVSAPATPAPAPGPAKKIR
jgi:Flp pilus assembly protein TadD